MGKVIVVDHPFVQHKLTILRNKDTASPNFRALLEEMSMLIAYEVTRDLPLKKIDIETPLMKMKAPILEGKNLVLVSILRAGNGILDGMLKLMPTARVGHIGLYRDPKTLEPVEYYFKLPDDIENASVIVADPMLATGNSAVAAVHRVKELRPKWIRYVSIIAAPEGIETFRQEHPDVDVYTAAIDERLNDHGYILPGLGDAGDRLFRTR